MSERVLPLLSLLLAVLGIISLGFIGNMRVIRTASPPIRLAEFESVGTLFRSYLDVLSEIKAENYTMEIFLKSTGQWEHCFAHSSTS